MVSYWVGWSQKIPRNYCHPNLRVGPHKAETKGMMVVNTPLIRLYLWVGIGGVPWAPLDFRDIATIEAILRNPWRLHAT